uniref:Probable RNA-binding protein EIF1AD n=1 Tax=Cyprinus carpio carpio TaxID=630221 RepID=A0A8C1FJQ7_CYPCA
MSKDFVTPTEDQHIMRVFGSDGYNLHEAVTGSGERFLVSMPAKFYFVIRHKGEISFILHRDHVQYLRILGVWITHPVRGTPKETSERKTEEEGDSDSEDDDSNLFVNTNHATVLYSESEEETDEGDDNEEEKKDEGRA